MIGDLQGPRPDELVQVTALRGLGTTFRVLVHINYDYCDTWPGCQVIL